LGEKTRHLAMKPYRVEYVQLTGWETDQVGLWIAENEDWLLLRHIPVDYVVDGYVLLAKNHIASRKPGKGRKLVEQILKLKGVKAEIPPEFGFQNTVDTLRWVEHQYGLVEFANEEESIFLGWLRKADAVHIWIDFLTPKGTVDASDGEESPFVISEIQFVRFDTDYSNSLKLLWQHKQRRKLLKLSDN
jgi:hypothetical protein